MTSLSGNRCPICERARLIPTPGKSDSWDCASKTCNNQFYFDRLGLNARDKYTGVRLWWHRNRAEVMHWLAIVGFTLGTSAACVAFLWWSTRL